MERIDNSNFIIPVLDEYQDTVSGYGYFLLKYSDSGYFENEKYSDTFP